MSQTCEPSKFCCAEMVFPQSVRRNHGSRPQAERSTGPGQPSRLQFPLMRHHPSLGLSFVCFVSDSMNETNQPNESKKPPAPNSLSECRLDPLSAGCDKVSLLWTYAIDPIAISPKLCISIDFPVSLHSGRSTSSEKSTDPRKKPTACGKAKDSSVKPQNVVGIFNGTQCLLLRQTGHRSLCMSPFSIETPLVHRVVHRSWGTA